MIFCLISRFQKINTEKAGPKANASKASSRPSQKSILAGIVRKRTANDALDSSNGGNSSSADIPVKQSKPNATEVSVSTPEAVSVVEAAGAVANAGANDKGAMKCIGILPGIGKYEDSSDSERSTDTDDEFDFKDLDWVGRKIKKSDGQCE